ncbi:tetratricopeptide repeat protein [Bacteroidota bacterium]
MKNSKEQNKKSILKSNSKLIAASTTAIILLMVIYFIYPTYKGWIYSDHIPELPDLEGEKQFVVSFLNETYKVTLENPASDEAVGNLAIVFHANFFYDEAEKCYDLAYQLNDDAWRWLYNHALIREELGDTEGTIELLKTVLDINDQVIPAWFRLGSSYLKQSEFEQAENAFNKIFDLEEFPYKEVLGFELPNKSPFPFEAYARLNLGRIAMMQNEFDKGVTLLNKTIEKFPTFGPAYRLLSQIYYQMNENEKGDEYQVRAGDFIGYTPPADPLFDAVVIHSRNSDFILKQIDIAKNSNNLAWAVYLNRHIFDYDPNDGESLGKFIELSLDLRKLDGLDTLMDIYSEMYKDNTDKLLQMAKYSISRSQPSYGTQLLDRVIELDGDLIEAHFEYVKILRLAGKLTEGSEYCRKFFAKGNDDYRLRNEYGRILMLEGNYQSAQHQFNLALRQNSKNEVALVMLGFIAKRKGAQDFAINFYKRAVDINPQNDKTTAALANYYIELRRWSDALELLEDSIKLSPNNNNLLERLAWLTAVCPDLKYRDPQRSLKISRRLSNSRKYGPDEEVKAGVALAVSYAANGMFAQASATCDKYISITKQVGLDKYITTLEYFKGLFKEEKQVIL